MDKRRELGQFLKSRRARLQPEDVGVQAYNRRRTAEPGSESETALRLLATMGEPQGVEPAERAGQERAAKGR